MPHLINSAVGISQEIKAVEIGVSLSDSASVEEAQVKLLQMLPVKFILFGIEELAGQLEQQNMQPAGIQVISHGEAQYESLICRGKPAIEQQVQAVMVWQADVAW